MLKNTLAGNDEINSANETNSNGELMDVNVTNFVDMHDGIEKKIL